jgi:hypothetical protein
VLSAWGLAAHGQDNPSPPTLDGARRLELAERILSQREEDSGRTVAARYRDSVKAVLAAQYLNPESVQTSGVHPMSLGDSSADLVYTPVTPCRVFDTRSASAGILAANTQRNFFVTGNSSFANQGGSAVGCGIPFGPATSVVINFVAVNPAGAGNLRAWAVADPQPPAPLAAVVNYSATLAALANGIAVPICDAALSACVSDLRLQADVSSVHVVGDVVGYFARPTNAVTFLNNDSAPNAVDIDQGRVICQTADITPAHDLRAMVNGAASLLAAGPMGFRLQPAHSSDGGVTWFSMVDNNGRGGAGSAGEWATAAKFAGIDLVAGTQYRFGLQITRDSGTADATNGRCDTFVQLFPR